MEAYTSFAEVYDTFMDNVPYEEWGGYIHRILCENDINDGILLDLGCGTGTMTELFAGFGYDMIGVDNSADMLEIAMEKKEASGHDILYLLQDMRAFELYGTVRRIRRTFSGCSGWLTITWIPAVFLFLILILFISTGTSWATARSRRTGENAVLSGIIIITKKSGSMNTI